MRKPLVIGFATALSTVAIAAPASSTRWCGAPAGDAEGLALEHQHADGDRRTSPVARRRSQL
jgi:hypothetical protein